MRCQDMYKTRCIRELRRATIPILDAILLQAFEYLEHLKEMGR
jgi:hypothetical protein